MGNGILRTHALIDELVERRSPNACAPSDFSFCQHFSTERDIFSPVIRLSLIGCPPAVIRFIISKWVDPIKCHPIWPLAHVGKEIFKKIPPVANGNPPPAIKRVLLCFEIKAPLFHGLPRPISRASGHSMGFVERGRRFFSKASAATCISRCKLMPSCSLEPSAFAFTNPINAASFRGKRFCDISSHNSKPTKYMPSTIYELTHGVSL